MRILVVNGHPDPRPERLCAALAEAYVEGAKAAGHEVRRLDVGKLDLSLIRSADDFVKAAPSETVAKVQDDVRWCGHLVLIHPLWLGGAPAVTKGFLEQVFRYGFAIPTSGSPLKGLLRGRSARLVVTMGMPAIIYRTVFGAFGTRALERGIFRLSGFSPVRHSILGLVEASPARRAAWLQQMERLGRRAV